MHYLVVGFRIETRLLPVFRYGSDWKFLDSKIRMFKLQELFDIDIKSNLICQTWRFLTRSCVFWIYLLFNHMKKINIHKTEN